MEQADKTVKVEITDGVAIFTMCNPPVNQLSEHFVRQIGQAFDEAFKNDGIKAIILTGTGNNFIAGADITQIKDIETKSELLPKINENNAILNRIEAGPKPVIAAINGTCLGGGLEIAMVCHYRIVTPECKLGLPEVQLGLIPGAGGTQRLSRLIGLPKALEMMTTGLPIAAKKAVSLGLADEIVKPEKLIKAAARAASQFTNRQLNLTVRRTRNINNRLPSAAEKTNLINFTKSMTASRAKGYIAPFKIIEAVEKGLGFDLDADLKIESDLFSDCVLSDVAKNLIGIFLNTRAAGRLDKIRDIAPAEIKKVAMLGGGVMGSGIVHLLLKGGYKTTLWEINDESLKKAEAAIRKTFAYSIKKRKMKEADLDRIIENQLKLTTSLDDLNEKDLIIEAVLENMKIKQDIWKKLESICRPETIFATNTSALPITEMVSILSDPGRMIGMHFFNPAERMQLLEIICTKKTSDQTLATSVAFARTIKKVPIVVNDGPGFYVSRQLGSLMAGAVVLMGDGAGNADIEKAMLNFGMPMGPTTLADLTGLDINFHVNKTFEEKLGERYRVHPLTYLIYETGCYGRKTGSGYYDYSGDKPVPNPIVMDIIKKYLKDNNIKQKTMSEQDIVEFMLSNAINEAAYMIEEGICDRPQDMDLAMLYGTGFPAYRGGILKYADKWGINNVYDKLIELEQKFGVLFKPSNLIKQMAEKKKTFYQD